MDQSHLRYQEGLEKSLRVIELSRQVDDPHSEVAARWVAAAASQVMGDLQGARLHAGAMLTLAETLGNRQRLSMAFSRNVSASLLAGDWKAGRDFSDRGLRVSPSNPTLLAERVLLEHEQGDFEQGEVYLDRLLEVTRLTPPGPSQEYSSVAHVVPIVSRVTGEAHLFDVAEEAAEVVLSSPAARPLAAVGARKGLALMAVQRSDASGARAHYGTLEPFQGTVLFTVATDRLMGLLAQTMGDLDKAAGHLEEALAFCRKAGYRPEVAWTCCDYADALLQRNSINDRQKAMSLLDESLAISRELGMRPLMERVKDQLDRAQAQPGAAAAFPDGLTHREVEVLRLIVVGRTNQEIGKELFITARTVANHVANILNKTGCVNRTEAATYASRQGLA